MAKALHNPGIQQFDGVIKSAGGGGAYFDFPFDVEELYGSKGLIKIKATFDGIPYRGSLANMGEGCHMLIILKSIREQIGKQVGDSVHITVELDTDPRIVEIPPALQEAFSQNPGSQEQFEKLSYTKQKERAEGVTQAKQEETRTRRIATILDELKQSKD